MLIINFALIIILSIFLIQIFIYLKSQIALMGNGQQKVISILLFLIIFNVLLMSAIILFNSYINQYRLIGEIGVAGDDGPSGDNGQVQCSTKIKNSAEC
jgi:hypothetical protein